MALSFSINQSNLEADLIALPQEIYEASQLVADTKLQLDDLKRQLEVMEADADKAVRNDPLAFGIAKISEKAVEAAVIGVSAVNDLKAKIAEMKHASDMAYAALTSIETKRKSLELMVQLKSISYYAQKC